MSIVISLFNLSITQNLQGVLNYLIILFYSTLIIIISILGKKLIAKKVDLEITHNIWHFERYGIKKSGHFKNPFPIGAIFPPTLSLISAGTINCFTFLQFNAKALLTRSIQKRGKKTYSGITEWDLAIVAFGGLIATLLLSLIADYFSIVELAKYSLYYSLWNLLPLGQLDGTKILFGSANIGEGENFFVPIYVLSLILVLIVGTIVLI